MAYNAQDELKKVKEYYSEDPLQKRFSALITGDTNAGKTFILRTARKPVHVDSFDPGGTKCLLDLIKTGDIVADTQWETDDPFEPKAFAEWKRAVDRRMHVGYYDQFGTVCIDSATTFGEAIMNYGMGSRGRAGEVPQHRKDYNPQKVEMTNYIRKLMNLPCDFILTGHLRENKELIMVDASTGVRREDITYRFYTTGQAVVTIPLLFDEVYVIVGKGNPPKREMLIDSLGKYVARSRLKRDGKLDATEPPDIKALLKKAGFSHEDKPKLKEVSDSKD